MIHAMIASAVTAFAICAWPFGPVKSGNGGVMTSCTPAWSSGTYSNVPFTISCSQESWEDGGCEVKVSNPMNCFTYDGAKTTPLYVGEYDIVFTNSGTKYTNPRCSAHPTQTRSLTLKVGYEGGSCGEPVEE